MIISPHTPQTSSKLRARSPELMTHFDSFSREEYGKLFDFVNAKKLNIKNRGFKEVTHIIQTSLRL